tara:strand:- start:4591 stop:5289 length:699 start_codon:yes stop_codon:yes gene_type:complete
MLSEILEISNTHKDNYCDDIKESSYIQKNICKEQEYEYIVDILIAYNDPNYSLLPMNEKEFYLKQKRLEIASEIEENESLIKSYNFNSYLPLKKIQSGLVNGNDISSLFFFSEYYKLKIYLFIPDKQIYYETSKDFKNKIFIENSNEKWRISQIKSNNENYTKCTIKEIHVLKKDIISYDIYDIPLKKLSSYKLTELQELAISKEIDIKINGKNKKKNILYDELRNHFLNLI